MASITDPLEPAPPSADDSGMDPTIRVFLAVIQCAINDLRYRYTDDGREHLAKDAHAWLFGPNDHDLQTVCFIAGVEVEAVRRVARAADERFERRERRKREARVATPAPPPWLPGESVRPPWLGA